MLWRSVKKQYQSYTGQPSRNNDAVECCRRDVDTQKGREDMGKSTDETQTVTRLPG
jgi:hypothetical protein